MMGLRTARDPESFPKIWFPTDVAVVKQTTV
jgi:hypothetical protein